MSKTTHTTGSTIANKKESTMTQNETATSSTSINTESTMTSFVQNFTQYVNTLPSYPSKYEKDHTEILSDIFEALDDSLKASPISPILLNFTIESVTVENFGNMRNGTINFSEQNLFAIVGPVGAGKTTAVDAVYFALTGESHKYGAAKNRESLITSGQTDGFVTVKMTVNKEPVVITRKLSFKSTRQTPFKVESSMVYKNETIKQVTKVKELLHTLLPLTASQIAALLFLKQGKIGGILEAGDADIKKLIISNVLNLKLYTKVFDALTELTTEAETKRDQLSGQHVEAARRLAEEKQKEQLSVHQLNVLKQQLQKDIASIQKSIVAAKATLVIKQELLADELKAFGDKTAAKIRAEIVQTKQTTCPVCEGAITNKLEELAQEEANTLSRIDTLQNEIHMLNETIKTESKSLKGLKSDLKKAQTSTEKLKSLQQRVNDIADMQTLHKNKVDSLTTLANCFDQRGPCIQKYLTTQLLKGLCSSAGKWIAKLTGKNTTVTYSEDTQFSFAVENGASRISRSFSGGEKTMFALAIQLAAREFFANKANISLDTLFIDEGFHTLSTDIDITRLMSAFKEQAMMVGVITHNHELASQFPSILTVDQGQATWSV